MTQSLSTMRGRTVAAVLRAVWVAAQWHQDQVACGQGGFVHPVLAPCEPQRRASRVPITEQSSVDRAAACRGRQIVQRWMGQQFPHLSGAWNPSARRFA